MKKMWDEAATHPNFRQYIPDEWFLKDKRDRTFFWGIISTLSPEYTSKLITECRLLRAANRKPMHTTNFNNISAAMRLFLLDEPYVSRARAGCHSSILIGNAPAPRHADPDYIRPKIVPTVQLGGVLRSQAAAEAESNDEEDRRRQMELDDAREQAVQDYISR